MRNRHTKADRHQRSCNQGCQRRQIDVAERPMAQRSPWVWMRLQVIQPGHFDLQGEPEWAIDPNQGQIFQSRSSTPAVKICINSRSNDLEYLANERALIRAKQALSWQGRLSPSGWRGSSLPARRTNDAARSIPRTRLAKATDRGASAEISCG